MKPVLLGSDSDDNHFSFIFLDQAGPLSILNTFLEQVPHYSRLTSRTRLLGCLSLTAFGRPSGA